MTPKVPDGKDAIDLMTILESYDPSALLEPFTSLPEDGQLPRMRDKELNKLGRKGRSEATGSQHLPDPGTGQPLWDGRMTNALRGLFIRLVAGEDIRPRCRTLFAQHLAQRALAIWPESAPAKVLLRGLKGG